MTEASIPRSFWRDLSVLVTGGTGMLGRWLVPALLERGARVVTLTREGRRADAGDDEHGDRVHWVQGSVCDAPLVKQAILAHSIDVIFHIAGQSQVGAALEDPGLSLDTNIRGTWTVLEASRNTRQCVVLLASSAMVYGAHSNLPHRESDPLESRHPYGVSKGCADMIGLMYAQTFGQAVAIMRFANLFGGGDMNFSRSIPGVVLATLRGEQFLIRSDGRAAREYLYVEDAVDACLLLAESLACDKSLKGEVFNFSLEQRVSVLEIADSVLRILKRTDLRPKVLGVASVEAQEQRLSAEKARNVLQWRPRNGMADGLEKTVSWYRSYVASLSEKQLSSEVS